MTEFLFVGNSYFSGTPICMLPNSVGIFTTQESTPMNILGYSHPFPELSEF